MIQQGEMSFYAPILRPLQWNAIIFGMAPFKLKNQKLVISKIAIIPSIILIFGNVILTVFYYKSVNENILIDFVKADTINFLSSFRDLGSTSVMVFILIFSYISTKKLSAEIDKIREIDTQLRQLNLSDEMCATNRKIRRKLITLLVIENFVFNMLGEIASSFVRDNDKILYLAVNMYPRLIIGLVNCSVYLIFMLLESRFEMINGLISLKIAKSHTVAKYPDEFDFSENICQLVTLHKCLVRVVRKLNSIYSLHFLICITINFILLIGDLHTSMYIIFFDLFTKHQRIVLDMMKNCITYIFELFYLAKRASDLCNVANRTKILLLGIQIDIEKENERNAMIACVLKLMQNKLDITACKLFNIDNALLFSICGAASSYLFIMLQLDIGNVQKSETTTALMTTYADVMYDE